MFEISVSVSMGIMMFILLLVGSAIEHNCRRWIAEAIKKGTINGKPYETSGLIISGNVLADDFTIMLPSEYERGKEDGIKIATSWIKEYGGLFGSYYATALLKQYGFIS